MEVDVYKNLHKDTWSIRNRKTGRVVGHSDIVHITNAKFVVQPAGRQRVLQELRKNVHAFVRGTLSICKGERAPCVDGRHYVWQEFANPKKIVYNPYESDRFRFKKSGKSVTHAMEVILDYQGVWIDAKTT